MWKVGQLSFLYPRLSWPTLIYGIATGPKIAKILLFVCVFTHSDFNVGKVMCFCIFILSRSFVFPFYRAGCLPADCNVGLNNFCSKLLSQHLHGLDIYLKSNHYLSNMTKMLTLPQKERGSKFCNFELFFSYCKYLNGGTHQGSVSNLIFTETFEWTLSWCRGITKLSVFFFSLKVVLPKSFFCQNKNYCSQENRLSIRVHDEEYLISKMDLKACLKYSWTEIAIPNSWLGRELFKAIPVYLFLTALIEPCLHDMCRCLLSSHLFMFDMCRCLFGS